MERPSKKRSIEDHTVLTVGRYLKKAREAKGLSLDEVSELTKISKFYLDYIERNEFEKLPQGPYAKGYISSYSKLIGSNVDEALRLFHRSNRKEEPSEEDNPPLRLTVVDENFPKKSHAVDDARRQVIDRKKRQSFLATSLTRCSKHAATFVKEFDITNRMRSVTAAIGSGISRFIDNWKAKMKDGTFGLPSLTKRIANFPRQTLLIIAFAIFGIAILVLAGFGFYYLFIFDSTPLPTVEKQSAVDWQGHISPENGEMAITNAPRETNEEIEDTPKSFSLAAATPEEKTTTTPSPLKESPPLSSPLHPEKALSARADATDQVNLTLLKATACSSIEDKNPSGVNTIFPFSVGRIYVWTQVRAEKIPTRIRHIYYLEGEKINDVALEVRSASWRTWSYKNLDKELYRGNWQVDIATSDGTVLRSLYFRVE